MSDNKNKPACIQTELTDYCFDQEVLVDPEYENVKNTNDIFDAPDDANLDEIRNLALVAELLSQKVKK